MAPRATRARTDDLVAAWIAQQRSPNTRAAYSSDLRRFVTWCAAHDVDPLAFDAGDLGRFLTAEEQAGAGPATAARRLSAISSFGAYTASRGLTPAFSDVERPTVTAVSATGVLDDQQAAALLAAADLHAARAGVLVRLLMLDGLKVGEVAAADAADVRGRPPVMDLRVGDRSVRLHPDTAFAIRAYLARRRSGPLVLSEGRGRRDQRISRFGIDYVIKDIARIARLEAVVSGNTLRRRYVVAAHANGDDLDDIRRHTGHADVRTTRRYLVNEERSGGRRR
jgi:integrase/recombinase XerD